MTDSIKVRAIFKFKGTNNDELKFKKGDIITITQKEDGGWWEGTLDGKTGWFPSNYVEEVSDKAKVEAADKEIPEDVLVKNIDYRQQVIRDLLEKEQEFVSDLRSLFNQFLQPLHHADILDESEYQQLVGNIEDLIEAHQRLNSSLEDVRRSQPRQQRLGQVFLQHGSNIRAAHLSYWSNHPRAVCIIEKHRDKLNTWIDNCQVPGSGTSSAPGLMVLTTGLSRPFRQLERLAGAIQEVEQHLEDNHADRGDTQRSIAFYKEVASEAARCRRQKELELEVLTGTVRGWEGEPIDTLGEIIKMGPVVVVGTDSNKKDKYLVLFPSTLLLLSASHRLSAFIYEGKLPLSGLSVKRFDDIDVNKQGFQISGSLIDTIHCNCTDKSQVADWINKLQAQIRVCRQSAVLPSKLSVQPLPPPHVSIPSSSQISPSAASPLNILPPPINLTPPYRELTQWIRRLLAENQLTMEHIRQLRKPFRVVSARKSSKPTIHRVECVIYPKPFNIVSQHSEEKSEIGIDNEKEKNDNISDGANLEVGKFVSTLPHKVLSRDLSCEKENVKEVGAEGLLVEDDDVITLVLHQDVVEGEVEAGGECSDEFYVPCQEDEMMFLLPRSLLSSWTSSQQEASPQVQSVNSFTYTSLPPRNSLEDGVEKSKEEEVKDTGLLKKDDLIAKLNSKSEALPTERIVGSGKASASSVGSGSNKTMNVKNNDNNMSKKSSISSDVSTSSKPSREKHVKSPSSIKSSSSSIKSGASIQGVKTKQAAGRISSPAGRVAANGHGSGSRTSSQSGASSRKGKVVVEAGRGQQAPPAPAPDRRYQIQHSKSVPSLVRNRERSQKYVISSDSDSDDSPPSWISCFSSPRSRRKSKTITPRSKSLNRPGGDKTVQVKQQQDKSAICNNLGCYQRGGGGYKDKLYEQYMHQRKHVPKDNLQRQKINTAIARSPGAERKMQLENALGSSLQQKVISSQGSNIYQAQDFSAGIERLLKETDSPLRFIDDTPTPTDSLYDTICGLPRVLDLADLERMDQAGGQLRNIQQRPKTVKSVKRRSRSMSRNRLSREQNNDVLNDIPNDLSFVSQQDRFNLNFETDCEERRGSGERVSTSKKHVSFLEENLNISSSKQLVTDLQSSSEVGERRSAETNSSISAPLSNRTSVPESILASPSTSRNGRTRPQPPPRTISTSSHYNHTHMSADHYSVQDAFCPTFNRTQEVGPISSVNLARSHKNQHIPNTNGLGLYDKPASLAGQDARLSNIAGQLRSISSSGGGGYLEAVEAPLHCTCDNHHGSSDSGLADISIHQDTCPMSVQNSGSGLNAFSSATGSVPSRLGYEVQPRRVQSQIPTMSSQPPASYTDKLVNHSSVPELYAGNRSPGYNPGMISPMLGRKLASSRYPGQQNLYHNNESFDLMDRSSYVSVTRDSDYHAVSLVNIPGMNPPSPSLSRPSNPSLGQVSSPRLSNRVSYPSSYAISETKSPPLPLPPYPGQFNQSRLISDFQTFKPVDMNNKDYGGGCSRSSSISLLSERQSFGSESVQNYSNYEPLYGTNLLAHLSPQPSPEVTRRGGDRSAPVAGGDKIFYTEQTFVQHDLNMNQIKPVQHYKTGIYAHWMMNASLQPIKEENHENSSPSMM